MKYFLGIFLSASLLCPALCHAELQINEVMQSNVHGLMDDLNDFPDSWVELYNSGDQAVNLADYALSVKDKASAAYKLPRMEVSAGAYVVVYCDKVGHGLHADFRVDSGKGDVILWRAEEKIETVSLKKMPASDVSYGREGEQTDSWGYQMLSTPGAPNCGSLVTEVLAEPIFSEPAGLKEGHFYLTLSLPQDAPADAVIHYTLDGAHPTADSPVYTEPISVETNTTVRAAIYAPGYITPLPSTRSYIFPGRELSLPVVSISGDPAYFYDENIGILVEGTYNHDQANYEYDWRRPVNVEYFTLSGKCPINQVIETRVKGGTSRAHALRSMVLYANKRFVTKRLEYEFFPEQKPGVPDFKSLELRNAGNDFSIAYMRDALMQGLIGPATDLLYAAYNPTILFINGEYRGIINMRERCNEDNIYTNCNGLEDVDVISGWHELSEGSEEEFLKFKEFYNTPGHTFAEYAEKIYPDQFADLMATAAIFNSVDFPSNNIVMWRPQEEDGKWGWILKDMDAALGMWGMQPDFNYLDWLLNPGSSSISDWGNAAYGTALYRELLATNEFRNMFIDRICISMSTYLHPDAVIARIDEYASRIRPEMSFHRALYEGVQDWETALTDMKTWYAARVPEVEKFVTSHFSLSQPLSLKIEGYDNVGIPLALNDVRISAPTYCGIWHPGRRIRLTASCAEDDDKIAGWRVSFTKEGVTKSIRIHGALLDIECPQAEALHIELVTDPAGIDMITDMPTDATGWYDLRGISLGTSRPTQPGIYLLKQGGTMRKVVVR